MNAAMPPIPGAVLSLVSVALTELKHDLDRLLTSDWDEGVRRRAEELASTLAAACDQQGLPDVAAVARALSHLTRLSPATAAPLRTALRRKFRTLLVQADLRLAMLARRYVG